MTPAQRLAHQSMMNKLPVFDHIENETKPHKEKKTGRPKGADHFRKKIKIPVPR